MPQPKQPAILSQTPESLVSKLREENAALKARITEARETINGYRKQLDAQNRATFRHSRLVRLLEALQIPIPSTDDEYISKEFLNTAREAIAPREDVAAAVTEKEVAVEAMRLLLGGKDITVSKKDDGYLVTFVVENEDLDREMSFNISWDDDKIEYNRISIRVAKPAAPQFADEDCIVFDFAQGPFFLAEVLSAVHGVPLEAGKDGEEAL